MTVHRSITRTRLAALIACSCVITTVPFSVQAASDGSPSYPVDGGLVPVDVTTSGAIRNDVSVSYQEAIPETATDIWVDPAAAEPASADPALTDPGMAPAPTEEWVDPAAGITATDPGVDEAPAQPAGSIDPVTGEWVDPAALDPATSNGAVDPATGEWVAPTESGTGANADSGTLPADKVIEPAPVETQVDPALSAAGGEPAPEPLVEPAPAPAAPVEPAPVAAVPIDPASGIASVPVDPSIAGSTEPWSPPIATAYIAGTSGEGATCHVAPDLATETLATLGEGQPVEVRGETIGEWLPVNCAGVGGYVHTSLLAWTPALAPVAVDDAGPQELATGADGGTGGDQIVSFAMQYQGYPYIYAGEGPYAFDCSGFTMFVIQNTLGIEIPHDMTVQYEMGQPVNRETLQPGDLVFFANTFRPGMSHNGVYIGGGQFIHAERESSGVKVSDLNSDYYSSRWYGAVRFR